MKMKLFLRSIAIAALTGAVLAFSLPVRATSFALLTSGAAAHYVPGEVLVKFKPTASAQERTATVTARGHSVFARLNQPGWAHVKIGTGQTVEAALAAYQNDPNVEYVQPNYIYQTTAAPTDTQYGQLWAFKNTGQNVNSIIQGGDSTYTTNNPGTAGDDVNIEPAWDHITDCSSVVVAVVDSGVNYTQEELVGNMWNGGATYPNHGYNYVDGNSDTMDFHGHGTHVAGIIGAAGNNAKGATGVCWKASIMAVRVMDTRGKGTTANIIQGINFAVANGAKVINMSLGGGSFDMAFSNAITYAQTNDVVVVVAAGNGANDNDDVAAGSAIYPCNFTQPNVVCVAALDQSYALANFSNYGATSVDVGAPGSNILSTWAGTNEVITDSLNDGWTRTTTTTGGWVYDTVSGLNLLLDPSKWLSGTYASNTDDRAYKQFNLGGVNVATLSAYVFVNVTSDGFFAVADSASGGDPFAVALPTFVWGPNYTDTLPATTPSLYQISADISSCISTTCTLGFRLKTGATADLGAAVAILNIQTLTINSITYKILNGTSMASPEVAGLATMLRAYNPQYTYADVVNAIKKGGRATASLAGKTTTGNAIDVMSSLAYINPPTGLTATVQ